MNPVDVRLCATTHNAMTAAAPAPASRHYHRPMERPFSASEKGRTTILIGGLTAKHERFIRAVFEGDGHLCDILPPPDMESFRIGKEYGNNGQCSPAYFTAGSLIQFLRDLERRGISREVISDRYAFFTAGACGPCRFGMYEAEYRMVLDHAGFPGFRVIRFQQDHGVQQKHQEPGLRYTVDFGIGMLKAMHLADALNDMASRIRAFEVKAGETDRVMEVCVQDLCAHLCDHKVDPYAGMPGWIVRTIEGRSMLRSTLSVSLKLHQYLRGRAFREVLAHCRRRLAGVEVDRTRLKPVVKIIGEFWAQTTESDGNYRMFEFLEREGAQVLTEPIGTWIAYLLSHARRQLEPRRGLDANLREPGPWQFGRRIANELQFQKKRALLRIAELLYAGIYHRIADDLGGLAGRLLSQEKLARLSEPYYRTLARGGEGYLEVAKNIYYTSNHLCHMVLSLKPFGCMPSSQSDGVQSAVVSHGKDMIYLPIETSGEGEINARSRAQMALGEAKEKAKLELQEALVATGRTLEEVRQFAAQHADLRNPFYLVPRRPGVAGVAAGFVYHVDDLMRGRAPLRPVNGGS